MSWETELTPLLRTMVGDFNSEKYTDATLKKVLVAAAYQVYQEIDVENEYTISIASETISPDPMSESGFANLITIKAACIVDRGAAMNAAEEALRVDSHEHYFDSRDRARWRVDLLKKGWCFTYEESKKDFILNNKNAFLGAAILTPFRLFRRGNGYYNSAECR